MKRKLLLWQRLREEIGMLVLRHYVDNLYLLPLYQFPQKVIPHVNVLFVVWRSYRHIDCCDVRYDCCIASRTVQSDWTV